LKILHITNWYPSEQSDKNAPFIKKQIDALRLYTDNVVWHIEIVKGRLNIKLGSNTDNSRYFILFLPFTIWRVYEWMSFLMVFWIILKEGTKQFNVVNFHIAYPNCAYIGFLKYLIKSRIVITEHWSAYHFNFNVSKNRDLTRIKKIFYHNIPTITVSNALGEDIRIFAKVDVPVFIVPNVIDIETFRYRRKPSIQNFSRPEHSNRIFLMVSLWKWPKDPFTIIKAWPEVLQKYPGTILKIGGYGPQWGDMKSLVDQLNLKDNIDFIGPLDPVSVAEEMSNATAFIHSSEYETFSVVCAEAVCCGTPVIAPNVGGISSIIDDSNGILFEPGSNIPTAIKNFLDKEEKFNPMDISKSAINSYSPKEVGNLYFQTLTKICGL